MFFFRHIAGSGSNKHSITHNNLYIPTQERKLASKDLRPEKWHWTTACLWKQAWSLTLAVAGGLGSGALLLRQIVHRLHARNPAPKR